MVRRWEKGAHWDSYRWHGPGLQNETFRGTHWKTPTPPHPSITATEEALTHHHRGKKVPCHCPAPSLGLYSL